MKNTKMMLSRLCKLHHSTKSRPRPAAIPLFRHKRDNATTYPRTINYIKYTVAIDASMTTRRTPLMDISNNDLTGTPVAASGRRKSGRAVKAPQKFIPDALSSQQAPAGAKRKRTGEDLENDASESEEDEDDSDRTLESAAEEEIKETRRKLKSSRKPVAKKPKVNGTASHSSAPPVRLASRPKKSKKVAIADKNAEGLYGTCKYTDFYNRVTDYLNSRYIHKRRGSRRHHKSVSYELCTRQSCRISGSG